MGFFRKEKVGSINFNFAPDPTNNFSRMIEEEGEFITIPNLSTIGEDDGKTTDNKRISGK